MFEAAELGRRVAKRDYEAQIPELRAGLLEAHRELRRSKVPVVVIVSGADGAGKGETVNRLHEWLDPRGLETHVFGVEPDSDEERERPPFWRFWRALPARGRIGILFGSWYTRPIVRRAYGEIGKARLEVELGRIAFFEQMLASDGALVVKFWLHLARKAQRKRLEELERRAKTRWRVSPVDWKHVKLYETFARVSERAISRTDAACAPWHVVEAADHRYRHIAVGRTLLDAMKAAIAGQRAAPAPRPATTPPSGREASASVLDRVDLSRRLTEAEYDERMARLQARLGRLGRAAWEKKRSSVFVFEGWDAAGKGGAIRRLTESLEAKLYRVIPIAAPSDEERAHHYLWRFWRQIPRAGFVTIYDRSWYGRVLVERVEGFATEAEWMRAYLEINDFEEQLAEHGIVLAKLWVHLSRDEQLRRFQHRQGTAYKQHKITDEDWRNREKWDAYEAAVDDMLARTSTRHAPWTLVAGDDKRFARVQVLETACRRIEEAL